MIDAVLSGDPIAADALLVASERKAEERLVDCMVEEGFEYRAVDDIAELKAATRFYELVTNGPDPDVPVASGFREAFELGLMDDGADPGISEGVSLIVTTPGDWMSQHKLRTLAR